MGVGAGLGGSRADGRSDMFQLGLCCRSARSVHLGEGKGDVSASVRECALRVPALGFAAVAQWSIEMFWNFCFKPGFPSERGPRVCV